MNKRLQMLLQITQTDAGDAFAWYGLAVEYRRVGQTEEALRTFETLRSTFPDYLAGYLMAGQVLIEAERSSDAVVWIEQGIALAEKQGNQQALGELQDALSQAQN